ncbi:MAG: DUF1634 domain-containing protein [Scytonematopsis contorta HA4267-MV1]|jgi:uncharacterized membrane protein|nr:DUF1634 domain-containing protein [Scytonematopsis contorta HA4267-MV1]
MHLSYFSHQDSLATLHSGTGKHEEENISKSATSEILVHNDENKEIKEGQLPDTYTKNHSEEQFEQLISNLLKYGVLIACSIVLVGGILYLYRYGAEPANYKFFQGESLVFGSPMDMVRGILSGSYESIIIFGILLLIATPVIRVVLSLLTFACRRDLTYTVVTSLSLFGLMYSFVMAYY